MAEITAVMVVTLHERDPLERGGQGAVLTLLIGTSAAPRGRRSGLGLLPHDRERVFHPSRCHLAPQTQSFEPPSTRMVSPVIQRASCEARNATTEPTSSGWPIRLSACMPRTEVLPSLVLTRFDMSVSITPGATALTRMPRGPRAAAKYFTNVSIAPFVAA